jgi:hypothetical protein
MTALWVVAAWHRLKVLDHAIVGSDSLGPYLQAQAALFGNIPRPPNPESGDALWLMMLPIVALADSLQDLFFTRFVLGGVVAPLGFAAAYHWTAATSSPWRRWAAAIAAGLFLAFDPGLLDTLVSGARSYGAPELIGITTLCAALSLRGYPWAPTATVISLVLAAGHHPLALGVGLGLVPLIPAVRRAVGPRHLRTALVLGGVVALPRLFRIGSLAWCGDGPLACLSSVAQSNITEPDPWMNLLQVALHDRWLVDLDAGAWLIMAGVLSILFCTCKEHRKAAHFALWGLAGVLLIGLLTGYVRSYHLRITAVPMAVAAGLGLARAWPLAPIAACIFIGHTYTLLPVGPDQGALARHDQVATELPKGPLWVDRVWWDGPPNLDPSGVVLSGWLAGRRDFQLGPQTPFILLENGTGELGWNMRSFDHLDSARRWFDAQNRLPHQRGGAYDWATISAPHTRLEDARW